MRFVYHRILAKHSGKCLDVSAVGKGNGDKVHQWECVCADNQLWEIVPVHNGYFRIVAKHSGKCLDVILAAKVNDARVHQWDYVGEPNQQWEIKAVDNLYCRIMARHSGKCLQVGGVTYLGNGSEVNQLDYVDGENQKWLFVPDILSFSSYFRIINKQSLTGLGGKDLDNQLWQIVPLDNGDYGIVAKDNGKCLEVAWEREDERLYQGEYVGADNQKWAVIPAGRFSYKIAALHSGKCLQASPPTAADASVTINQSTYVEGDNQLWFFIPKPAGAFVTDSSGEIYLMESDHRILIPDEDALETLVGNPTSIVTLDDSELREKPLWPLLRSDRPGDFHDPGINSLVRVLTRVALWAGLSQIGEPIPHSAIGLLDISENHTEEQREANRGLPVGQFSLGGREEWEKRKTGVFLSHSNKDKHLAKRIAEDLHEAGVYVWLDEWEIRVGDSITQEIQKGLQQTDFVAVLLSRHSVGSGWVEKEWQSKIGVEAEQRKVIVLPLKCDDCVIPPLLKDKKYADFSRDYQTAFNELVSAVKRNRASRDETVTASGALSSLKFITEGGTNTIFFSIANSSYGKAVTLSGIGATSYQRGRLLSGVPRIDLASLIEGAETVDHNVAALNLSSGDFFVLGNEVVRIDPGEVASFSLRLCRRELDNYLACRLVARLIGPEGEYFLPSDCVYLLKSGDTYSPYGSHGGPFILGRVLIRGALPVADILRTAKRKFIDHGYVDFEGIKHEKIYGYYEVQFEDTEYEIPDELLKGEYTSSDLDYRA